MNVHFFLGGLVYSREGNQLIFGDGHKVMFGVKDTVVPYDGYDPWVSLIGHASGGGGGDGCVVM